MQSSLKKSLYLGLAALSFGAVATVSTTASAKSYATAGAYSSLKADATTRNVEATGTNALYTKPGTVKGAKVVASKATMAKLASSKKSADYFRAYGVKTTNRGSVYYKVVTMDGKYRGYVYGGANTDAFGGGIKSANTTTDQTATNTMVGKQVYFANPGTANVTWSAPKNTQYKATKSVINTKPFTTDTLKVTKAATKTREGSLYYYVEDATHPSASGWIYSKAITTDSSAAFDEATAVKVNFVNDKGTTVGSTVLQKMIEDSDNKTAATTKGTAVGTDAEGRIDGDTNSVVTNALAKSGYSYSATNANKAALLNAKTGDTINVTVTAKATVTTPLVLMKANTTSTSSDAVKLTPYKTGDTASATTVVTPTLTTGFKGLDGASFVSADLLAFAKSNSLDTLYTPTYKDSSDNDVYTVYTLSSAQDGTYGADSSATLVYTAEVKNGKSPKDSDTTTTTDTGSIWATSSSAASTTSTGTDASSTN